VTPGVFLALTATVAVAALTPGPAVAAIVARAATSGLRPAMAISAGVVTGDLLFLGLAAAGLAAAARSLGPAFEVVKWLGAAWLLWQGAVLWRRRPAPLEIAEAGPDARFWPNYGAGLLLMFGHVQAMLFYAALLPGLVDFAALGWRDLGAVALMLVVVIGGVNALYALLAARARPLFASPRARLWMQRAAGSLMFLAAVLVATRV
jgi:threonine/homoserine/homoserine lactone efflux protein